MIGFIRFILVVWDCDFDLVGKCIVVVGIDVVVVYYISWLFELVVLVMVFI